MLLLMLLLTTLSVVHSVALVAVGVDEYRVEAGEEIVFEKSRRRFILHRLRQQRTAVLQAAMHPVRGVEVHVGG